MNSVVQMKVVKESIEEKKREEEEAEEVRELSESSYDPL